MNYIGAIIIQGLSSNVKELKEAWNGYNLIWSTWEGSEKYYVSGDTVIYNAIPKDTGTRNVALQQLTTLNGVLKAKELGYERVLKWRSDMIPTNADEFVKTFDLNSINMFFYHVASGGYFVDYFMEGTVNDIYNMWNFDDIHPPFAERALTNNIKKRELKNIVFMGNKIIPTNDVFWIKKNLKLSTYNNFGSGFIISKIND